MDRLNTNLEKERDNFVEGVITWRMSEFHDIMTGGGKAREGRR